MDVLYFVLLFIIAIISSIMIAIKQCGGIKHINTIEGEDIFLSAVCGTMIGAFWPIAVPFFLIVLICYGILKLIMKIYLFKHKRKINV